MKYIKLFNEASEYETFVGGDFIKPNVSYVKETKSSFYNPYIPPTEVGDILCANVSGDKKFVKTVADIPSDYVPIGVVVIPSSHDVYGDGKSGVMSLNAMSYSTPDVGCSGTTSYQNQQSMSWGGYKVDTSLPNFSVVNIIGAASAQTDTVTTSGACFLPSDLFTETTCVKDKNTKYQSENTISCGPSPYLTDGSRNPQYYDTSVSSLNALADFDGVGNTNILTSLSTGQTDWQTADTITNNTGATYYPAACCCWRYSTVGTSQGDWYLPACGELGYVSARRGVINTALQSIIDSQLVESCTTVWPLGQGYWSSSEYSSASAAHIFMDSGKVEFTPKALGLYVRAFCRV